MLRYIQKIDAKKLFPCRVLNVAVRNNVVHLHHKMCHKKYCCKKYCCLLCVVSVDRVEELLQFLGGQNSIGEVGFEFIKGQFPVIWEEKEPSFRLVLHELFVSFFLY